MSGDRTLGVNEVDVQTAYGRLRDQGDAVLIDVRTLAEWSFVGRPSLADLGKAPVFVEWQTFPDSAPNPYFVRQLVQALQSQGLTETADLYFICRSGGRSFNAALAMREAGWPKCSNVRDGFEGPVDASGHRGTVAGWKAAGLPWTQN